MGGRRRRFFCMPFREVTKIPAFTIKYRNPHVIVNIRDCNKSYSSPFTGWFFEVGSRNLESHAPIPVCGKNMAHLCPAYLLQLAEMLCTLRV